MKRIFKWLAGLALVLVVLAVIFFLSLDSIIRVVMENRIHAQTGMKATIGKFTLGLVEPTITIQDFKLFNPPGFGDTLFLDIREIHVEYDRAALAKNELHLHQLRFDLAGLDIVKNADGQTNIFSLAALPAAKKSGDAKTFSKETGLKFTGIDELKVSLGQARFIDLQDQHNNRSQTFGIENCVLKDVKTLADLGGLGLLIMLRGGDFFSSLMDKPAGGGKPGLLDVFF